MISYSPFYNILILEISARKHYEKGTWENEILYCFLSIIHVISNKSVLKTRNHKYSVDTISQFCLYCQEKENGTHFSKYSLLQNYAGLYKTVNIYI